MKAKETMNQMPDHLTLDDACTLVQRLDIYDCEADRAVFIDVTIRFTRQELLGAGLDMSGIASNEEWREYCNLWCQSMKAIENDLALIALNFDLTYQAKEIALTRKEKVGLKKRR